MNAPPAPGDASDEPDEEAIAVALSHPNLPRRGPIAVAFAGIVIAGTFGALIGYGLVRTSCLDKPVLFQRLLRDVPGYHVETRSCELPTAGGTLLGAAVAAIGAGVVAVLMLRAMHEWRAHPPEGDGSAAQGRERPG